MRTKSRWARAAALSAVLLLTAGCGRWIVEGYAATVGENHTGNVITEEELRDAIVSLGAYRTVLFNHDMNRPVGRLRWAVFDGKGLLVNVEVSKTEPGIWRMLRDGTLRAFSIRQAWSLKNHCYHVIEVSVVSVPADQEAKVSRLK